MNPTSTRRTQIQLVAGSSKLSDKQRNKIIAALEDLHDVPARPSPAQTAVPTRRPARAPLENGGRTWGDPTGQTAVRNVTFERLGISEELLEDVEETLHANPGMGIRKMAKALGIARLTAEAAVEALILAGRLRVIGGLYV